MFRDFEFRQYASIGALLAVVLSTGAFGQTTFSTPEVVADGAENNRLSRNPDSHLAFDSQGRLHLAYWRGGEITTPSSPSYILYRNWTASDGWSAEVIVDDSTYDDGSGPIHFGGRHPSLAIGPDDTVWVVWHDHRHSDPNSPFNSIDNIEIYADSRLPSGDFSSADIRITNSSAAHLGDNGYTPKVAVAPDGTVTILWFDFHHGEDISDIYVKRSDTNGVFDGSDTMDDMRVTDLDDRGGSPEFTVPALAVTPTGDAYAAWSGGTGGANNAFYMQIPDPTAISSPLVLEADSAGFFDPVRMAAAPDGSIWHAFTDLSDTESDVVMERHPGSSTLTSIERFPISDDPLFMALAPDIAIDGDGNVHTVYIRNQALRILYYARFDSDGNLIERRAITEDGAWQRPSIEVDADGRPHIVYEEDSNSSSGTIWFTRAVEPSGACPRVWGHYQ